MSMRNLFCIRPKGFNVGNDVIFLGMEHFIERAFGRVVNLISVPATARYESAARAGLTRKLIYEMNLYGDAVVIGGGNLYENGELDVDLDALDSLDVPLMIFSVSMGRVFNRYGKLVRRTDAMPPRVIQALNAKAALSLARDEATYAHLHELGASHAVLGGCPTIFLDRMASRLPEVAPADRGGTFISVRHPELMNIPLPVKARMHQTITDLVAFLRRAGHDNVRLLCHDQRDIPFAASFEDIDYVYTGDAYVYLALLRSASLCVSLRLHSVLPCLSFGTPVIPLSYDERSLSLIETVGFGDWQIDLVREPNVAAAIADRYDRLGDLPAIRREAEPTWSQLYNTMLGAFQRLAALTDRAGSESAVRLRKAA